MHSMLRSTRKTSYTEDLKHNKHTTFILERFTSPLENKNNVDADWWHVGPVADLGLVLFWVGLTFKGRPQVSLPNAPPASPGTLTRQTKAIVYPDRAARDFGQYTDEPIDGESLLLREADK